MMDIIIRSIYFSEHFHNIEGIEWIRAYYFSLVHIHFHKQILQYIEMDILSTSDINIKVIKVHYMTNFLNRFIETSINGHYKDDYLECLNSIQQIEGFIY
jgi:hypothetical protein